tara:strand:+ start:40 stop:408 length:369 start_codon:yes stop_codon:yes gene_type:complete
MKKYNFFDFNNIPSFSLQSLFIIIIFITIFNFIYVYSTKFKKVIVVDEKHTYGSNNSKGSQSISDTNNNVYILKDSIYVLHWTSVEVFNKLDEGNKYEIEGHGIRFPIGGMFPNITKVKLIN